MPRTEGLEIIGSEVSPKLKLTVQAYARSHKTSVSRVVRDILSSFFAFQDDLEGLKKGEEREE